MADLLRTARQVAVNVENTIIHAKAFVFIVTPDLADLPDFFFNLIYSALLKGVVIRIVYSENTSEVAASQVAKLRNLNIYFHPHLQSSVCVSEKEAVVTSLRLFPNENITQFGIHVKKAYSTTAFKDLVNEVEKMVTAGTKMTVVDQKFVSIFDAFAAQQKSIPPEVVLREKTALAETKRLTIKEKQKLLVDILSEQCACPVKVEDEHRIRIQGTGIVIQLTTERVDVAFVHYETYQARMQDVKKFITSRHPDLKAGFTYNRMTFPAQNVKEVTSLFETVREVIGLYKLI